MNRPQPLITGLLLLMTTGIAFRAMSSEPESANIQAKHSPIRLKGLLHSNDRSLIPTRDITKAWPFYPVLRPHYLQGKPAGTNPTYLLHANDVIELRLEPENDATPRLDVTIHDAKNDLLIKDLRRPRIPVSVLFDNKVTAGTSLTLWANGVKGEVNTGGIALGITTWEEVATRIQSVTFNHGGTAYTLNATLIPVRPSKVRPYDRIHLYRTYSRQHDPLVPPRPNELSIDLTQRIEHILLQVDQDGFLWIPPLTTSISSVGEPFPTIAPNLYGERELRRFHAAADRSYFRLPVARVQVSDAQPTIADIAESLSSLYRKADGTVESADLKEWRRFGFDDQYLPKAGMRVRYHFELESRPTWTLVDEAGNRLVRSHGGRELLVEAVMQAYRELTGMELVDAPFANRPVAYLVVIPNQELVGMVRPFYGRVDIGDLHCELKYFSLEPGDTVMVSRREPQAAGSSLP